MSRNTLTVTDSQTPSSTEPGSQLSLTMVSTPGDGSCGIGTYASDLLDDIDIDIERVHVPQDDRSFRQFTALAVRVPRAGGTSSTSSTSTDCSDATGVAIQG